MADPKPGRQEEAVFEYTPEPAAAAGGGRQDRAGGGGITISVNGGGGAGSVGLRRQRTEYEAYGASNLRGFEPPEQRLSRLTAEVADLIKLTESQKSQEAAKNAAGASIGGDPAAVQAELRVLEQRLGGLARDGVGAVRSADAQTSAVGSGATAGSLAVQLERLAAGGGATFSAGSGEGRVTYEISYAPTASSVSDESKIAALENTVAGIEKQLGVFDQGCPFADLQTATMQVQRRISSLDSQKIDAIRSGVHKTMSEVDAVLQKRSELEGVSADPDLDRKANELFEFCHRWNAVAPSLPTIVQRLQSLQALHQESSSFTSRLAALETQQEELAKLLETTNTAVEELGTTLQSNMAIVRDSMRALEEKVTKVVGQG
mmetsp:Transcript_113147/g.292663  ORF Transcript_113147/g.292663 Transcript_113147/m.292663 type:complete len:376 (-) Transcript_113147:227-1354(-)